MTGLELLEALRRAAPDLPVAVLTAHPSLDYACRRAARPRRRVPGEVGATRTSCSATVSALVAKGRAARLAARQTVLAIGAHPDDVEIGAAGALLVHRGPGPRGRRS